MGVNRDNISNSYATGSVSGDSIVGGLVGVTQLGNRSRGFGTISGSFATGSVFGIDKTGGLVGVQAAPTTIRDSYATGSVFGTESRIGGLVGYQHHDTTIRDSFATGSVFSDGGDDYVGGLVGQSENRSIILNSYYADRGQNNDWGTERTFTQLRCPTMFSGTCSLSGPDQRTYEDWDTNVWSFGTAADLPQLSSNRNSELNLKPYISGSDDLVVVTGFTGIMQLPLVADYQGTPGESVTLTWSLPDVPTSLRHLVYFDLGDGTTSTTFTDPRNSMDGAGMATLVIVGNRELSGRSFYVELKNNISANDDRIRVRTEVEQPYISENNDIRMAPVEGTTKFSFFVDYAGPAEQPVTLTWSLEDVPTTLSHLVYFDLAGGSTSTTFTDGSVRTNNARSVTLVVVGNKELAGRSFYVVLKNNVSDDDDRVRVQVEVEPPEILGDDDIRTALIGSTTTFSFSVGYTGSPVPVTLTWTLSGVPDSPGDLVYFVLADGSPSEMFTDSSVFTSSASTATLMVVGDEGLAGKDFYVVLKNNVSASDDRVTIQVRREAPAALTRPLRMKVYLGGAVR